MENHEIVEIIDRQRAYFDTGATLTVSHRIGALKKLHEAMLKYGERIEQALHEDLGKSGFESFMCESGLAGNELDYMIKHTGR